MARHSARFQQNRTEIYSANYSRVITEPASLRKLRLLRNEQTGRIEPDFPVKIRNLNDQALSTR